MQIHQPRRDLILILGPALFFITLAIIFFIPQKFIWSYCLHWLILGIAIITAFTPLGRWQIKQPANQQTTYSRNAWLTRLIAMQICIYATFYGITQLASHALPVLTNPHPHAFSSTLSYLLFKTGLLPWAMIIIVAINMAYIAYQRSENAMMSTLTFSIFKSKPLDFFGLNVNTDAKLATYASVSSSFALLSLLVATSLAPNNASITTGFRPAALVIGFLLLIICILKPTNVFFKKLFSRRLPLTFSLSVSLFLFATLLIIFNWIAHGVGTTPLTTPGFVVALQAKTWQTLWLIFAVSWWLGWIPTLSAYIVRISYGYSIRSIIFGALLLPLFISILNNYLSFSFHHAIIDVLISLTGFAGLLYLLTQQSMLSSLVVAYFPKNGEIKNRDHHFFLRRIMQLTAAVIYLYLPTGIYTVCIYQLMLTLPMFIIALLITAAHCHLLFKSK